MKRVDPPAGINNGFLLSARAEQHDILPVQKQFSADKESAPPSSVLISARPAVQIEPQLALSTVPSLANNTEASAVLTQQKDEISAEFREIFESSRIHSQLITCYKNYAKSLIGDYPPESHRLVMFGAQNVLLSGVLATMMPLEKSQDYIRQLPFKRLSEYRYQLTYGQSKEALYKATFQKVIVKAIKAVIGDADGKKIILVRVLYLAATVKMVTKIMIEALGSAGIHYGFDYLYPALSDDYISELKLLYAQGLRLRFDEEMGKHLLYSYQLTPLIEFNPSVPVNLSVPSARHPDSEDWSGFQLNPEFPHLVAWLTRRLEKIADNKPDPS